MGGSIKDGEIKSQKWGGFSPTFWEYSLAAQLNDIEYFDFPLNLNDISRPFIKKEELFYFIDRYNLRAFFICNPNNPTGHVFSDDIVYEIAERFPQTYIILDLTYDMFEEGFEGRVKKLNKDYPNIIFVMSYSKFFCLPGLRIGSVLFSCSKLAEKFLRLSGPLRINNFAEKILLRLFEDHSYISTTRNTLKQEWKIFEEEFRGENITKIYSLHQTNSFRLFYLNIQNITVYRPSEVSNIVSHKLLDEYGIRVCNGSTYGINNAIRIRVGLKYSNLYLIYALKNILSDIVP
jgi:threonine-phosphate decarboxylase